MSKDKLNIIIPIYNPILGWEVPFIESLCGLEKDLMDTDFKVVLVNDGSTSEIYKLDEILNRFGYLTYYPYHNNKGKGFAIRYGISKSDADYYFYTDVDFPFGYNIIYQAYQVLKTSKTNVVIGTRDRTYFRSLPLERRIISLLLKEINYLITGFQIKDTQAGMKGMDNKARQVLTSTKVNGFIFDLEFLKTCIKQGLTYSLINVSPRRGIVFTDFRFKTIAKEIINFLKVIF
jgi:cellulose synthase/poly-beta-1,6-N-acetylglucosamine synthase-like glycosyltransferase